MERMAVEAWVIDAGEMMIEADVARRSAAALHERGDSTFLLVQRQMGNALIALENLGYTLTPPSAEPE